MFFTVPRLKSTYIHTYIHTYRQTDRQTDRQTSIYKSWHHWWKTNSYQWNKITCDTKVGSMSIQKASYLAIQGFKEIGPYDSSSSCWASSVMLLQLSTINICRVQYKVKTYGCISRLCRNSDYLYMYVKPQIESSEARLRSWDKWKGNIFLIVKNKKEQIHFVLSGTFELSWSS